MEKSLDELLVEKEKLKTIIKEKNKIKRIKNVKVFSRTIKRITPYILSTTIASTAIYLYGFGIPFLRDDLVAKKVYEVEYQTPELKTVQEKYETSLIIDYFSESELVLYTPFTLTDDEMYTRKIITYKFKNIDSLEIYEALKNNNYEYILENIRPVTDETEKVNMLNNYYVNDYYVDVHLKAIDSNDTIIKKEGFKTNLFVTLFDCLSGLWLGILINNRQGKKTYNDELYEIYDDYNACLKDFYNRYKDSEYNVNGNLKQDMASLNEKIKGAKRL